MPATLTCEATDSFEEAAKRMTADHVMRGRTVVGVISMRDLLAIETWLCDLATPSAATGQAASRTTAGTSQGTRDLRPHDTVPGEVNPRTLVPSDFRGGTDE
jgi:hypothetical protein